MSNFELLEVSFLLSLLDEFIKGIYFVLNIIAKENVGCLFNLFFSALSVKHSSPVEGMNLEFGV